MYAIQVTEIGEGVSELLGENMMVFFGPTAPKELRDFCVIHDGTPTEENTLEVGGQIVIGEQAYSIVEFGDAANTNMGQLGHLTVVFGGTGEILPGSVRVEPQEIPQLTVGMPVKFVPAQ